MILIFYIISRDHITQELYKFPEKVIRTKYRNPVNWKGHQSFDIYFCVFFNYCQSLISGTETGHYASTQIWDF